MTVSSSLKANLSVTALPAWFKQELPSAVKTEKVRALLKGQALHTVCQSARCPNRGQCWGQGVAAVMILGETCTRACRFCAVSSGRPQAVDGDEPQRVADLVKDLGLRYVVITSVTRDDLEDGGAGQFSRTVRAIRRMDSSVKVEVLIPDFQGNADALKTVADSGPQVIAHNLETVRRLSGRIRPRADYQRSLDVLARIKKISGNVFVKSGLMAGLGETDDEIQESMCDLVTAGCDILTIGQYLAPSKTARHVPVDRFVQPRVFEKYARQGRDRGLRYVFAAPLVRSSFLAEQAYDEVIQRKGGSAL